MLRHDCTKIHALRSDGRIRRAFGTQQDPGNCKHLRRRRSRRSRCAVGRSAVAPVPRDQRRRPRSRAPLARRVERGRQASQSRSRYKKSIFQALGASMPSWRPHTRGASPHPGRSSCAEAAQPPHSRSPRRRYAGKAAQCAEIGFVGRRALPARWWTYTQSGLSVSWSPIVHQAQRFFPPQWATKRMLGLLKLRGRSFPRGR